MFDDLSDVYDAMIQWPKRLAHEEPFYRKLFEENGVRRCSGLAAVLQYGGFQHLLENAALLVTATNAADSDCAMLDTVADTICYACRTRKIPFAVLARTPEGDFITRINDDAPRKAEETTLDGVAELAGDLRI